MQKHLENRASSISRNPLAAAILLLAAVLAAGCASNAATGKSQLNFYSEAQEIEMGRKADREISTQMGVVDDPALQLYISELGAKLAASSERPALPWSFKVMDDPIVNAFALPGGFIYVTRGILGHISSEAELVSVLGHEIGHVTAQHSVNQLSKAQLAQGGLLLGMIVVPEVAQAADLAGVGLQALFLKYGRDDERQADDLGLRYMSATGFETREMPKLFRLLGTIGASSGAGRIPNWLSSHPEPEARAERSLKLIAERAYPAGKVNAASFVERLDGLAYGADPRQGFFEGSVFYHPELKLTLRFPPGWKAANEAARVVAMHPDRIAVVELQVSQAKTALEAARTFEGSASVSSRGSARVTLNGLAAVRTDFTVTREQGSPLSGTALFVEHENRVFQLLGIAVADRWRESEAALSGSLGSFARLTDPARLNAAPQRIKIVRLPRAMTFNEFVASYPSDISAEAIRLVNRVDSADAPIPAGTPLKRIVGKRIGDE